MEYVKYHISSTKYVFTKCFPFKTFCESLYSGEMGKNGLLSLSRSLSLSVPLLQLFSGLPIRYDGVGQSGMGMALWRLQSIFWLAPRSKSSLHTRLPNCTHSIKQHRFHGYCNKLEVNTMIVWSIFQFPWNEKSKFKINLCT